MNILTWTVYPAGEEPEPGIKKPVMIKDIEIMGKKPVSAKYVCLCSVDCCWPVIIGIKFYYFLATYHREAVWEDFCCSHPQC